ncbi:hypothetical protein [Planktotalea arctica]|uniref:hypothetical protein n=1 Tax=Planktotalea arctica TaxID=1481893 RepID=UPI000A171A19|nr:hypothetical protein [Planktotalea arctica]
MDQIEIVCTQEFDDGPKSLALQAGYSREVALRDAISFRSYIHGMRTQVLPAANFYADFLYEKVFVDAYYPPPVGAGFLSKLSDLHMIKDLPHAAFGDDEAYFAIFAREKPDTAACVFFSATPSCKLTFWDIGSFSEMQEKLDRVCAASNIKQFVATLHAMQRRG